MSLNFCQQFGEINIAQSPHDISFHEIVKGKYSFVSPADE